MGRQNRKPAKRKQTPDSRLSGFRRRLLGALTKLVLAFAGVSVLWVLLYRFVNPPATSIMVRDMMKGVEVRREWRDLDRMSPKLPGAAIAAEDGRFCAHWGFDFSAMTKAAMRNADGKALRGGSTISQQVAKNAFLWPDRSYVRKGLEAWFTVLIEALWPKHRIMEVYLNIIEWGPGIYGADAASLHYFAKPASKLSSREAARLIAVLPSPIKNTPKDMSAKFAKKANRVKKQLPTVNASYADCVRRSGHPA